MANNQACPEALWARARASANAEAHPPSRYADLSREELLAELEARDRAQPPEPVRERQVQDLQDALRLLEEARARFAALYDAAPLGCCTVDAQGNLRELNRAAAEMLGRERRHLLGWPLAVAAGLPAQALRSHLRGARRRPVRAEFTLRPAGARPRVVEVLSVALPGGGCHLALLDVSPQRRAEAELRRLLADERRARVEAEAAALAKDAFLGEAAHELGRPLAAMSVWLHILRTVEGPQREAALDILEQCTRAQTRQVEDLLEVARGRRGRLRVALVPLDPWPPLAEALEAIRPVAEARGLRLVHQLEPGLGRVWADPVRLRQIASNLLANAVQYTPPGGEVTVALSPLEEGVRLVVRDTGRGISPEALPRVFTTLWREGEPQPGPQSGLGLGLAIVQQLVEAHGGEIHAESAGLDKGTAFVVHLRAAPVRAPSGPPPSLGGARVLVVDDDEASGQALAQHLGRAGAQATATTADAAGAALQATPPEVLLLNLSEARAQALLKRLPPGGVAARVVSLSTSEHPGVGAYLHLQRPVEPNELVSHLLRVLQTQPRPGF